MIVVFLGFNQKAKAYSVPVENYISSIKKSKSPDQQLKIFSRRLSADLENSSTVSEIIFACAENIFKISPEKFPSHIQLILKKIKNLPSDKRVREIEKNMPSLVELAQATSVEAVYSTFIETIFDIAPEKVTVFFNIFIRNKQTHLFLASFEKNENKFLLNEKIKVESIKFFCLTTQFNGVTYKCIDLLKKVESTIRQDWQKVAAINAHISGNQIVEAKKILADYLGENLLCKELKDTPWINLLAAQVHRANMNYTQSIACLELFKLSQGSIDSAMFFYNLESAKSNYKINMKIANKHISACQEYIKKYDLDKTFFSLILNIEKMKSFHINKKNADAKNILTETIKEIDSNALSPYSYTLSYYKKVIESKKDIPLADKNCSKYFECADLHHAIFKN